MTRPDSRHLPVPPLVQLFASLAMTAAVGGGASACGDDAPAADTEASKTSTGGRSTSTTQVVPTASETTAADGSSGTGPGGTVFELPDGTVVRVQTDGGFSLWSDERRVFALRGDPRIRGRRFTETYGGGLGLWSVGREAESEVTAETFVGATAVGDTVQLDYLDTAGASLTLEVAVRAPGEAIAIRSTSTGGYDALALPLDCDDAASFHGFGAQYEATDQRGEAFRLWLTEQGIGRDPDAAFLPINGDEHTTYFPMAYYLDARGFGGLFTTPLPVEVDLCATDPQVAWFEVRGDVDLTVFMGPTGYDVIRELGDVLGRPSKPPTWAWEPWIGAQGGQEDVAAEVTRLQQADIPFSAMWVQDWTGIRPNLQGGSGVEYRWRTDTELYPDLEGFIADLHAEDIRFLGYANPFIDPDLDHFEDMSSQDMLVKTADGEDYVSFAPNGQSAHPDFTAAATGPYVQSQLRAMVETLGMDGWMSDFGEWIPLDAQLSDGSDVLAYHNSFPLDWHAQWRAVMDELRPDGDFAVFARSGVSGSHADAQIYWIGDQEADFSPHDGLPTVVPAMLNLGLSGIPFVTHDVAGFSGGPSTKELFFRWTELGAFTPIMRTHEGNLKDENWRWESDPETTEHFRRFARVHVALAAEIALLADEAEQSGIPIVRALMLEFPEDPAAAAVSDAFLLGPDLLVAPVVVEGATSREVVFPAGAQWFHVWTGEAFEGGTSMEVAAPLGSPPVFSRDVDRADLRAIEG